MTVIMPESPRGFIFICSPSNLEIPITTITHQCVVTQPLKLGEITISKIQDNMWSHILLGHRKILCVLFSRVSFNKGREEDKLLMPEM